MSDMQVGNHSGGILVEGTGAAGYTYGSQKVDKSEGLLSGKSGALGEKIHITKACEYPQDKRVSAEQAHKALHRLFNALPRNKPELGSRHPDLGSSPPPSLSEYEHMDPMLLGLMINNIVITTCELKARSICQQVKRAGETQNFLRNKQVKDYQSELKKEVEQQDKARKAGIFGVIFDWIVGVAEAIYGAFKIVAGLLSGNPLEVTDGTLYMGAGFAGMVKAFAETMVLCGFDKDQFGKIANIAGDCQMGLEVGAMVLDMFQLGQAIKAARGAVEGIVKGVTEGVEQAAKAGVDGLEKMAEELTESAVDKALERSFGAVEKEMVAAEEMNEAAMEALKALDRPMAKTVGEGFTRKAVTEITKKVLEKALEKVLQKGITAPEQLAEQVGEILEKELKREISRLALQCAKKVFMPITQALTHGSNAVTQGILRVLIATEQKVIDGLVYQQGFIDTVEQSYETLKASHTQKIQEAYKNMTTANEIVMEELKDRGTTMTAVARHFA